MKVTVVLQWVGPDRSKEDVEAELIRNQIDNKFLVVHKHQYFTAERLILLEHVPQAQDILDAGGKRWQVNSRSFDVDNRQWVLICSSLFSNDQIDLDDCPNLSRDDWRVTVSGYARPGAYAPIIST